MLRLPATSRPKLPSPGTRCYPGSVEVAAWSLRLRLDRKERDFARKRPAIFRDIREVVELRGYVHELRDPIFRDLVHKKHLEHLDCARTGTCVVVVPAGGE